MYIIIATTLLADQSDKLTVALLPHPSLHCQ